MTAPLPEMDREDNWRDASILKQYLARQLRRGRLALVIGAGVSKPLGLPDWEELVARLFAPGPLPAHLSVPQLVQKFKSEICDNDEEEYKERTTRALYKGLTIDLSAMRKTPLLGALGALLMSSRRGSAEVLSLNFDDLLERYLRYHGMVVRQVAEPDDWSGNADVQVYHPHGFLPSDPKGRTSHRILFSDSEFLDAVGKTTWAWRARFESLLRSHTCLFLGVSGHDMNLRSLMEDVKKIHAGMAAGEAYWGVSFRDGNPKDVALDGQWARQSIYRQELASYDELPEWLFEICQLACEGEPI